MSAANASRGVRWRVGFVDPFMIAAWVVTVLLSGACSRAPSPSDVALEYGRALYAYDTPRIYRLASARDRAAKDEASVAAQLQAPKGFALELLGQLAGHVSATPVEMVVTGDHATVTLKFTLPNANDAAIKVLVRDWDEERLQMLTADERAEARRRVEDLARRHQLPVMDGEESFQLVKEAGGWRLVLNWAGGIPLRFAATPAARISLELTVTPERVSAKPGESFRVTVRARNASSHEVTSRVAHRIAPEADAKFLALLQCPLFLPATFKPRETKEFVSEYLLLNDTPDTVTRFDVTYAFTPQPSGDGGAGH